MDKEFDFFLRKFGQPTSSRRVDAAHVERYRGKLPDRLLEYWQSYGWCSFKDGLFWIVDPSAFEDSMAEWVGGTPIPEQDAYHVIARSGFGTLYLWGTKTGHMYEVQAYCGWVIEREADAGARARAGADRSLGLFFGFQKLDRVDLLGDDGKPLFERAVGKLGPLGPDEVFGFVPAVVAGGSCSLDRIAKLDVHVHLSILAQFGQRKILDEDALKQVAFGG